MTGTDSFELKEDMLGSSQKQSPSDGSQKRYKCIKESMSMPTLYKSPGNHIHFSKHSHLCIAYFNG